MRKAKRLKGLTEGDELIIHSVKPAYGGIAPEQNCGDFPIIDAIVDDESGTTEFNLQKCGDRGPSE